MATIVASAAHSRQGGGKVARRELAERYEQGILVRLFWNSDTDEVELRYRDDRTQETFLATVSREHAMDAFLHPNCYRPLEQRAA